MKAMALIIALALATGTAAAGKLYKWVDKNGDVHYTDQPPPPEAKIAERKKFGDQATDAPVPYALQQAVKNFPVTLYNADCGDACSRASALLNQRGIPFTEKNARDSAVGEELRALNGGKLEVPVMKLGTQVVRGYEEGNWNNVLDAAGYPKWSPAPARTATAASKPAQAAPTSPAEPPAQNAAPDPARQ
ncbi:MAG TPA: glutaredoxin family protein [Burkholderiales bacterium]|nr:glutaredoxin family protein [Burkholderiales bacterium]